MGDAPLRELRHGKRGGRDERGLRKAGTYGGRKSKLKPQGNGKLKKGKRR